MSVSKRFVVVDEYERKVLAAFVVEAGSEWPLLYGGHMTFEDDELGIGDTLPTAMSESIALRRAAVNGKEWKPKP